MRIALHEDFCVHDRLPKPRLADLCDAVRRHPAALDAARRGLVAEAIEAAENDDFSVFETLLSALEQPYAEQAAFEHYQLPPEPEQKVLRTFCGT